MPIRLLIVDDNAHFLEAARRLLEREGMTVVGVASTTLDALRRAEELQPDVTLVDIELGQESGFDLARRLAEGTGSQRPPVILISAYPEQDLADLIDASPALGFLAKSALSGKAIVELVGRTGRTKNG
jgi:CheY-like chemotaxis protein